jgi:RNA polymerase sigma factor (sigma-70 family)
MAHLQPNSILRHIHLFAQTLCSQSDAELLRRFAAHREEEAFLALMRRHGRLVWGVCRHILRGEHDAEDAFQATFLVLATRASSIRKGESLASWLHGVAYRIAVRAKRAAARRKAGEQLAAGGLSGRSADRGRATRSGDLAMNELRALLDEEVARLPAKWRAPFVLCCLEGRSRAEAAAELGWKEGTVSSRIAQARRRLRHRLARRGVSLSGALAVGVPSGETVPAALVDATGRAALLVAAGRSVAEVASPAVVAMVAGGTRALIGLRSPFALVLLLAALGGAGLLAGIRLPTARPALPAPTVGPGAGRPGAGIDRFGDPLPAGVLTRIGSARLRHNDRLRALAVSPDGKLLATAGRYRLRIQDAATGKLLRQFVVASDWGHRVAFSPDSSTLVSVDGYHDLTCRRLDLATGKELSRFYLDLDADAELSPDGKMMVVCDRKTARLYDTASGRKTAEFPVEADGRVALRPDGRALAVTDAKNGAIRIYELPTGNLLRRFDQPGSAFVPLGFSPDGRWLATNTNQGKEAIRILEAATGKERVRLQGSLRYHTYVSFSPDGRVVAATGPEATDFCLWDLATGKRLRRVSPASPPRRALFSPDGKTLFTECRDGAILAWDVKGGKRLPLSADPLSAVRDLRFDRRGKRLRGRADVFRSWDSLTGLEVRAIPRATGLSALSPDGALLAASTNDGTIQILDARSGASIRAWKAHDGPLWALAFSADGARLFSTGGRGPRIRAWEVKTGRKVLEMGDYRDGVFELVASPDGRFLASTGNFAVEAADLRLWDLKTGREARRFPVHLQMKHYPVFSPDGRWLAAATARPGVSNTRGEVRVWEVLTGKRLRLLAGHKQQVTALAFSPDSRVLATGGADGKVCLWDLGSGQQRKRLLGHEGTILSLAFAPDNRRLAASSPEAPVYVWDVTATRRDPPRRTPTRAECEARWRELGDDDPGKAYPAVLALAAAPARAIPLLRANLRPVSLAAPGLLRELLAGLDSDQYAVREKAGAELAKLGESAVPAMRDALARDPSAEVARRLKALLIKADEGPPSAALLRGLRAVAVLEQIGTPEAKRLLRAVAGGAAEARLTGEARAALQRIAGGRE